MLTERFDRALLTASELHRKQKRKTSGTPYVSHLLGVCALVLEDGGSEDEAIAALLHDAVEDQSATYAGGENALREHIAAEYGAEVGRLVDALTERPTAETAALRDKRERWRAHKRAYINQIITYDVSVLRISCADSLYNVRSLITGYRSMGEKLWTRFMTREAADQLWGYSEISRAFLRVGGTGLAAELEDAIDQLHRLTGHARPEM
jgi:(p)ppGpp synthase/HD superfamily hydrolase